MRKTTLVTTALVSVLGGAVAALPASATSPQIHDPVGDTAVASQDISTGLLTVVNGQLQGTLTLAAGPAAGVPTSYAIGLYPGSGCAVYVLQYDWKGIASESAAHFDWYSSDECSATPQSPTTSVTAAVSVAGNTVTISAPLPSALPVGSVVTGYGETTNGLVLVTGPGRDSTSVGGDLAFGDGPFSLG